MNILPKKRWHVRTKDNIARVRRDEAEAAEKEKERERRAKLAEQEARTALLRQRVRGAVEETSPLPKIKFIGPSNSDNHAEENSTQESTAESGPKKNLDAFSSEINKPCADIFTESGNINFFKDLETGVGTTNGLTNKEHEAEERVEKEKYEKQIGLLTYLGQDSLEATKSKEWYHDSSKCISSLWTGKDTKDLHTHGTEEETEMPEVGLKCKSAQDPLNDMIKYTGWKRTKSSGVVGITAAAAASGRVSSSSSEDTSSSPPSPKKKKKLKKLLKERRKLDEKISSYSKTKLKKRKKNKTTLDGSLRKRKRAEDDDEARCKKRKKSQRSSKAKKSKRSKPAKKTSSTREPRSDTSSSSDSYTTDSEAEREEREEKQKKLEKLRQERLAREAVERQRERRLLAGQKPDEAPRPPESEVVPQKYSSQFNPLLARQNKGLQSGVKYF